MRDTLLLVLAAIGGACLVCTAVVVLYAGSVLVLIPKYSLWRARLQRRLDAHLRAAEQRKGDWLAVEDLIESTVSRRAGARGESDG